MSNKWYSAQCFNCGHKDSSEHFLEVRYEDDMDMRCPKCLSWKTGEEGESNPFVKEPPVGDGGE